MMVLLFYVFLFGLVIFVTFNYTDLRARNYLCSCTNRYLHTIIGSLPFINLHFLFLSSLPMFFAFAHC